MPRRPFAAAFVEPPQWKVRRASGKTLETISRSSTRAAQALPFSSFFLLVLLRGWSQPFAFRLSSVAPRGIVSELH